MFHLDKFVHKQVISDDILAGGIISNYMDNKRMHCMP